MVGGTQWGGDTRGGMGVTQGIPPPLHLLGRSAAREEVAIIVAVQGDVEHSGVAVEGLLGAVPMVDVLQDGGGSHTRTTPPFVPPPGPAALTQSTMRIRPTLSFCCSSLAEMATELKKQNPLLGGGRSQWGGGAQPPTPPQHSHGCRLLRVVPRGADDGESVLQRDSGVSAHACVCTAARQACAACCVCAHGAHVGC